MGVEDSVTSRSLPDFDVNSTVGDDNKLDAVSQGYSSLGDCIEDESDDVLLGVLGYAHILVAVTKLPAAPIPFNRSSEAFGSEIQT
ncbi:hypothetical protein SO802_030831 [Lithocarpus litseifolius]|uniref:Uncharacterized protein n=1 Tax=Lithocarpus litseifolius TaxID=425828 RepID=A0AAW2BIP0_9ROSI